MELNCKLTYKYCQYLNYVPSTLACPAEGPPQRSEPVGRDSDYGTGVPWTRRAPAAPDGVIGIPQWPRLTTPALDRTNLALSRLS